MWYTFLMEKDILLDLYAVTFSQHVVEYKFTALAQGIVAGIQVHVWTRLPVCCILPRHVSRVRCSSSGISVPVSVRGYMLLLDFYAYSPV